MSMKNLPMLSKSRFLAGLQGRLRLWYQCYERELIPEVPLSRQASLEYLRTIASATPEDEKARIRGDLQTYYGLDTLAMVKIRDKRLSRAE